jgi:hypothetical protein
MVKDLSFGKFGAELPVWRELSRGWNRRCFSAAGESTLAEAEIVVQNIVISSTQDLIGDVPARDFFPPCDRGQVDIKVAATAE